MITASYHIEGGDFARAGGASRELKEQLRRIGVEPGIMRRVMIAAYEAEMNVVIHALRGTLWAQVNAGALELEVVDEGPGIIDVEQAMRPGYSTAGPSARALGFGAGMGLPNIRKSSDHFRIDSQVGRGTRVRSTIFLHPGAAAESHGVSTGVLSDRCRGCHSCLKACPTAAVRVRDRHPEILAPLCIDCTECIAACPSGVYGLREISTRDRRERLGPAATLVVPVGFLTGFGGAVDPMAVLEAFEAAGFRAVRFIEEWEKPLRGAAAELTSGRTEENLPTISPLCPAVLNLVAVSFPGLLGQVAPFLSPVEALRDCFRYEALTVVPACPAQQSLLEADSRPGRLEVLSPEGLRALIRPYLRGAGRGDARRGDARRADAGGKDGQAADARRADAGRTGAGRENVLPASFAALPEPADDGLHSFDGNVQVLRAGGMRHVVSILEAAEKGLLGAVGLLELTACAGGCIGSPLFLEDPFIARLRRPLRSAADPAGSPPVPEARVLPRSEALRPRRGVRLDGDMSRAIEKLSRIDALTKSLPGRDCGACGCPSCAALAEDIVLGRSRREQCLFLDQADPADPRPSHAEAESSTAREASSTAKEEPS